MKLSEVPVVVVTNPVHGVDVPYRMLDFGMDYRGHGQRLFHESDFVCSAHLGSGFAPSCESCQETAALGIEALNDPKGAYRIEVTAE